jgi:outer membrane protein assembly factor BamD (BamD/ComL family)
MGGERAGQGQHFCLCLALLIFFTGCSLSEEASRRREMRDRLQAGNQLLRHGDFDGSLKTFQSIVVTAQDKPPADVAVYKTGVIYAHPNNPERDLGKALTAFSQVVSSYPSSPWVEQARAWVEVLKEAERSRETVDQSRQAVERSQLELEKNRQAMEKSKQEIERARAELDRMRQEMEKSRQVIEKYKQVDIEIDQKRRDRAR